MNCGQSGCPREGEARCYNCGQSFCFVHYQACVRCMHSVCANCKALFHKYTSQTKAFLASCGEWPTFDPERRKILLGNLRTSPALRTLFITYLKRVGFVPDANKIYVAITAQQRGDFHKFKWSIASNRHLVALLPLNDNYEPSWLKDLIGRAEALELVAEGRWLFVHSSLLVSSRDKEGKQKSLLGQTDGKVLSGFSDTPFHTFKMQLAESTDSLRTLAGFTAWAVEPKTRNKIYNIDTIVPLFNSELVRTSRSRFLERHNKAQLSNNMCEALISRLQAQLKGRDALVLWGSRTGGSREYLTANTPAREFRHKTGKKLLRHLASASGHKVVILAGDPLTNVTANIDLTSMWERSLMKERFGVDHSFDRIEQEYVFYALSKLCTNTLHIGMQSGNIETLINNPSTNVICVNENTKGGAGLVNVERISLLRHSKVRKGDIAPCHLYLPYNLSVLPTVVGELTRFLMEKYGESISMGEGVRRLITELKLAHEPTSDLTQMIIMAGRELAVRLSRARPDMLSVGRDQLVERLLTHLAAKLDHETKIDTTGELRVELKLLRLLAASCRQKVQYAICCLNNIVAHPLRSRRELMLEFVVDFIGKHPLFESHKEKQKQSQRGVGALPTGLEERAKVLLAAFRSESLISGTHEQELATLQAIVEDRQASGSSQVKMSSRQQAELDYDPQRTLEREWAILCRVLEFEIEDQIELAPVLSVLSLKPPRNW